MNTNNIYWMDYSIEISKKLPQAGLGVGAVLVSAHNTLICSAYAGEGGNDSWSAVLLSKIKQLNVSDARSIYVTVNTLSADDSFDLNDILKVVHVDEVYIGLPDPALLSYMENDPAIEFGHIYRYPDELQRKILNTNDRCYSNCDQSINRSPYYSENRISNLVIEQLKRKGFVVSKDDLNANKSKPELALLICNRYGIDSEDAINAVHSALAEAFNIKYGAYDYSDDTRSLDLAWKDRFMSFYTRTAERPLHTNYILSVGVGSGNEAIALFSDCTHITFVDIAKEGLEKIKRHIPLSNIIVGSADDLSPIPDNSYDLYVSLRTFNSSFFNIAEAVSEARRVLRPHAIIIASVANGFLCPERCCIIPGLILPGTEFVDIYRGLDTIKRIRAEFLRNGFVIIQLLLTNTEIYLSAAIPDEPGQEATCAVHSK